MDDKVKICLRTVEDVKRFIDVTCSFKSDIDVITDRALVDGKSILGVFSLDLLQNIYARIISDDPTEIERFKTEMEVFK